MCVCVCIVSGKVIFSKSWQTILINNEIRRDTKYTDDFRFYNNRLACIIRAQDRLPLPTWKINP